MSNVNLVYGFTLQEFSVAQVDRALTQCLGGHRFESCQGHRFFLCPTLMTCWSFNFRVCFMEPIFHSFKSNFHLQWSIYKFPSVSTPQALIGLSAGPLLRLQWNQLFRQTVKNFSFSKTSQSVLLSKGRIYRVACTVDCISILVQSASLILMIIFSRTWLWLNNKTVTL